MVAVDAAKTATAGFTPAMALFTAVATNESVARAPVESPDDCVVAVVPFGNAGVPLRFAAVVALATAVVLIAATSAAAVQSTGAPVVVVLHNGPVARPERSTPLIPLTVVAPPVDVLTASPLSAVNVPLPPNAFQVFAGPHQNGAPEVVL